MRIQKRRKPLRDISDWGNRQSERKRDEPPTLPQDRESSSKGLEGLNECVYLAHIVKKILAVAK
jgi:hypothetical protein